MVDGEALRELPSLVIPLVPVRVLRCLLSPDSARGGEVMADIELDAMQAVWTALRSVDAAAARRIVDWANDRLRYRSMVESGLIREDGSLGAKFDKSQVVATAPAETETP